ncbi:MAG TPA: hypothetical protein VM659_09940 [Dongiaceae bacterium]|nr:hypothetical protein [Dongiaceae bacterium]
MTARITDRPFGSGISHLRNVLFQGRSYELIATNVTIIGDDDTAGCTPPQSDFTAFYQ